MTTIANPLGVDSICGLLTSIITAVAGIVGAISVIMITVAGIMYLLSAGDPNKMETAKKALFYAIIGLAIAVSASTIVAVIKQVVNANSGGCT
ncbi:MAG: TrbC/VirB2 family protein [Candidatus Staskawiczbacteria bacterium]|nr:TrbC/VirB2 family protein [Candidatus Staskawiczbacteria bacterium]